MDGVHYLEKPTSFPRFCCTEMQHTFYFQQLVFCEGFPIDRISSILLDKFHYKSPLKDVA